MRIATDTFKISIRSDVCGWYCLLFDYALEHKQMDDSYVEDFERFLNNWSDNTITNNKLLKSIFEIYHEYFK